MFYFVFLVVVFLFCEGFPQRFLQFIFSRDKKSIFCPFFTGSGGKRAFFYCFVIILSLMFFILSRVVRVVSVGGFGRFLFLQKRSLAKQKSADIPACRQWSYKPYNAKTVLFIQILWHILTRPNSYRTIVEHVKMVQNIFYTGR